MTRNIIQLQIHFRNIFTSLQYRSLTTSFYTIYILNKYLTDRVHPFPFYHINLKWFYMIKKQIDNKIITNY